MVERSAALRHARTGKLVFDRAAYLSGLVVGRNVLDVGVVEHTQDACESPQWLHRHLCRSAARCRGVDILPSEVEYLRSRGFDVVCADITVKPLTERFDVVVCGEVLEHITAPGQFMRNCAAMLGSGGRLVITVPNPWYANVVWKTAWRRHVFVDSADHVAWYDASTLYELGQRSGLRLDRYTGIGISASKSLRARTFFALQPLLISAGISAESFAKSIIYEFIRG